MSFAPLVVSTRERADRIDFDGPVRDAQIENVHLGAIAVVSVDGSVLYAAGDPHRPIFTRSTLKPLQALPFVRDGGLARYRWGSEQLALMCASHSGEPMHTERVAAMLESIDCDAGCLQCGTHVPGWYAATHTKPPPDLHPTALEHNCSGKHTGFLAACRLHGEPVDRYLDHDAPVQRRVNAAVADVTGLSADAFATGTDGCSAPNLAMPLSRLAVAYARLAQGRDAPVEPDALGAIGDAMTRHPELVSGTARTDRALMLQAPGDWVSKIGADGVQAIGIRSRGIGIAIKIAGGDRDALTRATVETLTQLDLLPRYGTAGAPWPEALESLRPRPIRNGRGLTTGRLTARFTLESCRATP